MSALPEQVLYQFRPMTYSDIDAIYNIEVESYTFPWTKNIFFDCLRAGHSNWVLMKDTAIVGYIIATMMVGEVHILNICTAIKYRKQGYGREMLNFIMDRANLNGISKIFLEVQKTNNSALQLYISEGFNQIAIRENYYPTVSGREDALVMAKRL